jgi:capsular exopolysaccharide synthesis family protein
MAIDVRNAPRIAYRSADRSARDSVKEELDWLGLGRTLWRRKLFLATVVGLTLAVTAVLVGRMAPGFEAESQVMLNDRPNQVVDIPEVLGAAAPDEARLQAQILLIQSRGMAELLADRLHLHLLPEFNPTLQAGAQGESAWFDPAKLVPMAILNRLPKAWADSLLVAKPDALITDDQRAALLRTEIVSNVLGHIQAAPANQTTVMSLKFMSSDPALAALGANTLADLYIEETLDTKQSASRRAREFLEQEITRLRASVAAADEAIQAYRRRAGLVNAGPEPVDAQQLAGLTAQLVLSSSERAQAEARLRQVEQLASGGGNLDAAAQMLDSATLEELRVRDIEINRQIAELSNELGANHPTMVNLKNERSDLNGRIDSEVRRSVQRLRDEVQVLRSREASLESNIASLKTQLGVLSEAGVELAALERDAEADRTLLETYLARVKEITSQEKAQTPDARVISRAIEPTDPTYPRKPLILGVAFFGSLLLGSLAVFGLERLDHTFRSSEQIEEMLGLPALGMVPAITGAEKRYGAPEDYVLDQPNSPFGEAVRSLRTAMLLTGGATPPRIVLLTSSVPSEGKSSLALCLARVHASSGRRTLIIDCDIRRPRLHELARVGNERGLTDLLVGGRALGEVAHEDARSGAVFVTAGAPVHDPAALMASDEMQRLLEQVSARFDLIILDSPPVLSVSDARVLAQMVDKTVFLVHWGSTRRHDVMMGVKQLVDAGADLGGVVLSRVNVREHSRYGYRDSGHYYDDKYTKYYTHN